MPEEPALPGPDLPPELLEPPRTTPAEAAQLLGPDLRRSWLVPLLACPIVDLLLYAVDLFGHPEPVPWRAEARQLAGTVCEGLERVTSTGTELTPEEAAAAVDLVRNHGFVLHIAFSSSVACSRLLGFPSGLEGQVLIRHVGNAIARHPAPLATVAALGYAMVQHLIGVPRRTWLVPVAYGDFAPISRAVTARAHELGFTTWADALRHSDQTWDAELWRETLMTSAFYTGLTPSRSEPRRDPAPVAVISPKPRPDGKAQVAKERDRLKDEIRQLRHDLEVAKAEAAAIRRHEAELVQARDRAHARADALAARERAARDEIIALTKRLRVHEPAPHPVAPEPIPLRPEVRLESPPADLLAGRTVYLFTSGERGATPRAQGEALRALGPDDVKVYDMNHGARGPAVFPPGSVVVVDVRFTGHSTTGDVEARADHSPGVILCRVRAGQGGLARRVADEFRRATDQRP